MLVAISGVQSCGKSTVLAALKTRGFNVVERKTSRSILTDWGVTLHQVNNDLELTKKFQEEITNRKVEDELVLANSSELWFTERTHTDLFVYTLASMGKNNEMSDWLNNYYNVCKANNQHYLINIRLQGGLFPVVHDDVRGSNYHYAEMIEMLMEKYNKQMLRPRQRPAVISSIDISKRCDEILYHVGLAIDYKMK